MLLRVLSCGPSLSDGMNQKNVPKPSHNGKICINLQLYDIGNFYKLLILNQLISITHTNIYNLNH